LYKQIVCKLSIGAWDIVALVYVYVLNVTFVVVVTVKSHSHSRRIERVTGVSRTRRLTATMAKHEPSSGFVDSVIFGAGGGAAAD